MVYGKHHVGGEKWAIRQYRAGKLEGPAKYYLNGAEFECIYENDELASGYKIPVDGLKWGANIFFRYEDGRKTEDKLVYEKGATLLIYKNGFPFSGFQTQYEAPEYNYLHYYSDGNRTVSYKLFRADTLEITIYDGKKRSVTQKPDGSIIARTVYHGDYASGETAFYQGVREQNWMQFRQNCMVNGCIDGFYSDYRTGGVSQYKVCRKGNNTYLSKRDQHSPIRMEIELRDSFQIPWPFSSGNFAQILYNEFDRTEQYFEVETGKLLTTCVSKGFDRTGLSIVQERGVFKLKKYKNGYEVESWNLTYEGLLKKLDELSRED